MRTKRVCPYCGVDTVRWVGGDLLECCMCWRKWEPSRLDHKQPIPDDPPDETPCPHCGGLARDGACYNHECGRGAAAQTVDTHDDVNENFNENVMILTLDRLIRHHRKAMFDQIMSGHSTVASPEPVAQDIPAKTEITCDRCGRTETGTCFAHGGLHLSGHTHGVAPWPASLDLCARCEIEFRAWLKKGGE